ncbi:hypothetical protein [Priestia flexa]|nr:hypothetical protein [Priestia flexa]MED3824069.1 hypothetical protein [Priestia flexa]
MEPIETKLLNNRRLNDYPLFKKFCVLKEKGKNYPGVKAYFYGLLLVL